MESISLELGKEKELFSTTMVNGDSSGCIESPAIELNTLESVCSRTGIEFENSWSAEKESNHTDNTPVKNTENNGENSSTFSYQYSSTTYPKDSNIFYQNLIESSDLNEHVSNVPAEKFNDKIGIQSTRLSNELQRKTASNFENGEKLVPTDNEHVLDNYVKDYQLNSNCQSDIDSGSINENNAVETFISKSLKETPCSVNLCLDLKPCMVVLKRCDKQINDSILLEKYFNCNTSFEQLDTISVLSDVEEEEAGNHSGFKLKRRELKSKKSHARCSQSKKKKSSFSGKHLQATIKGTSKIRKRYSKIIYDSSDSDLDNDKLNSNECTSIRKKTIQVSAQVHKPPETDQDSDAFPSFTHNDSCKISPEKRECKNNETDFQMNCDDSNLIDQIKLGKRKRNPSSVSTMTFSDLECVSSKKRVIMPRTSLLSSQLPTNINHKTLDSDLDVSDYNHLPYSSEINEKLLTPNKNRGIHPTQNELSDWTNQSDVDIISHLDFKPCQVVLSRCDDLIEMTSSNADVNLKNLPAMRSSSNFKGFLTATNKKRCNPNVSCSDSISNLSELSDTDEILRPPKKTSPEQKLKIAKSKRNVSGSTRTNNKKDKNKSGIINEIIAIKNIMKRVERKIDKLLKVHLQVSDSY